MPSSASFSLIQLVILLLSLLSSPIFLTKCDSAAIDFHQWCQRTSNVDVCNAIIQNDPRADLKTSPSGILTILTEKAKSVVALCSFKVVVLLESRNSSPQLKKGLERCWIAYKRANQTLDKQNYYGVINKDTYRDLNCNLGRVYDQPVICETAFGDQPGIRPPLTPEDVNLMTIAQVNAQILNIFFCNQTESCFISGIKPCWSM
ncbi:hypothetical protein M9H77_06511 [Catharanthus roseus]|uniref:Uncharacterized protein n=1 Tax=Catharanthus roseus TaxID=4058 RepID=A0ACC0BSD2_CATRO|nr:hypothetical protein M9H77_06511 [Catharanthus roseus]